MTASPEWPAGTRVRCVDDSSVLWMLTEGRTYVVKHAVGDFVYLFDGNDGCATTGLMRNRFKPVVRVKMGWRVEGVALTYDVIAAEVRRLEKLRGRPLVRRDRWNGKT